ncbi:ABC transporter permease [Longispora fulva]|uniref:Putative ABC transport system permease protein n=1 Tax=Longispora fulva TaxID=619741 RepID=A0A8J7GU07_9ACTN|nr:FtsX-like permease family protein [Longispora fulva]MBG6139475.1 putative ABC transport system permease protein [Longispora fulva]GIG58142.1 ABC transporter permease [Longispora fulva]
MLGLALRTLRFRKASFVGAFLALCCAAALVSACGLMLDTGLRGGLPAERYAGMTIVAGDQELHHDTGKKIKTKPLTERVRVPADLAATLRAIPGVRTVVPELSFPAVLPGVPGPQSLGHAWESAALGPCTLADGRAPATGTEVVLDAALAGRAGVRTGDQVTVQSTGAPARYTVVGLASPLRLQSAVFFAPAEAERLFGHPGEVTAFGVDAPGVNLGKALAGTPARVYTGADRGGLEFPDSAKAQVRLVSMSATLGGTALIVAILVVVGTFALLLQQRYREIALLRAIGATPRQIRRLIGGEALLVGVVAGGLGSVLGIALMSWLRDRFVAAGAIPAALDPVVGFVPPLAAALVTVAAGLVAALVSARRAIRIRPTEALAESSLGVRTGVGRLVAGAVVGVLALAGTGLLTILDTEAASSPVTYLTVLLWCTAVSLLGPPLARGAVAVLAVPLRRFRIGGWLAAANSTVGSRRLASVITPLTLMVAMTCTVLFMQSTTTEATTRQANDGLLAEHVLGSATGVPTAAATAARAVPGVTTVTEVKRGRVLNGLTKLSAQGVTPAGADRTLDLGVSAGDLADLAADKVAVSARLDLRVGTSLSLSLGDGTRVSLTVIAVYDRGLGFPDVTIDHDLLAAHVDNPLNDMVLVRGGDPASLAATFPGLRVLDRTGVQAAQAEQGSVNAQISLIAMGLVLAFTAIAVVNTLALSVGDRRREFALLRLVGATRRQVLGMLRWESAVVAVIGLVFGTAVSLAVLTGFSVGLTGAASPQVPLMTYIVVALGSAALAFASTLVPGRLALRANPADTIGARQ